MDKSRIIGVAALVIVTVSTVDSNTTLFPCSEDVCNYNGKPQFCSDNDRCIDCDVREHLCDTWKMPKNCSEFCSDRKRTNFIARTCAPLWNIANGYIDGLQTEYGRIMPGQNLTFKCDEGFRLIGNKTFWCNDHGQWIPESQTPMCILMPVPSETNWYKIAVIILCIMLFGSIVMNCVCLLLRLKSMRSLNTNREQALPQTRTPSRNSFEQIYEALNTPFINDGQNQDGANTDNGVRRDNHELDALDRMNQPNSIIIDIQNTQVKTGAEGSSPEPRGELDDLPDTGLPDSSHNNGAIKHPIQVQSANEYEMGCEPLPRQETEKVYKKNLL